MLVNFFRVLLSILEVAACVTGFIVMPKLKNTFWKYLPYYLLFIVVGEVLGYYWGSIEALNKFVVLLFNYIISPAQILFFNWLLYKNISLYNSQKARWVLYGAGLYVLSFIFDCLLMPRDFMWVDTFSYCVGMVTLLFALLLFFHFFINSNDIIFYKTSMAFWVCVGMFFYFVATLPFEGLRNTLLKVPGLFIYCWYGYMCLASVMYLLFIISFIWTKPK